MAHFVLVPDPTDPPQPQHTELFAGVRDVCSVTEVAEAFGVCAQTVRKLIANGELESIHVGRAVRVTKTAMLDFIAPQGVQA